MIVRMPDGREIVVDVKTPLDAYLSAVEATDDETRRKHLEHHARKVRERVRELASKAYWNAVQERAGLRGPVYPRRPVSAAPHSTWIAACWKTP